MCAPDTVLVLVLTNHSFTHASIVLLFHSVADGELRISTAVEKSDLSAALFEVAFLLPLSIAGGTHTSTLFPDQTWSDVSLLT